MKLFLVLIFVATSAFALDELVKVQEFKLDSFTTVRGKSIKQVRMGYETYGTLNEEKSNAILIAHYFTGNGHAAGKYTDADKALGYWDAIIGPGKALDTNKYFIVTSTMFGSLTPTDPNTITTGPASMNPATKKPYGMSFPEVTVRDSVNLQKALVDSFGIKKLFAVAGASGGAAQAVDWSAAHPEMVGKVIAVIGPGLSLPAYTVALLDVWSAPIMLDPKWNKGNYYNKKAPIEGLTESLKVLTHSSLSFDWATDVGRDKIQATLTERAKARAAVIDANSLIYMARAVQTFDVEKEAGSIKADVLFVPASSDLIFPPELSVKAAKKLCDGGKKAGVYVIQGKGGHLDGIAKISDAAPVMTDFLNGKMKSCKF